MFVSYRFLLRLMLCAAVLPVAFSCKNEKKGKADKEYEVLIVEPTSRILSSVYSATIRGKQDIDIRTKVSGYITDIFVKEGATVSKGQTLFVIDQVPYEAALQTAVANVEAAQAAVDAARLTLDSKQQLYNENIIAEFDLNLSKTALASEMAKLAQAKANEVNARNNLSYTLVKSPVDGVLGTLPFRVGTLVSPSDQTPMSTVSDNSEMYVYFSMTEAEALSLTRKYGSLEKALQNMPSIRLQLNDASEYSHTGRIEAISGIIDQSTGAVSVRAKFPNPERLLLSGGSGNVVVPHEQKACLVIPQAATFERQDKIYVYKIVDGHAVSTIITVNRISDGKEYVVRTGIEAGEMIVAAGVGMIKDGAEIKIKHTESEEHNAKEE